jgi:hypothetical protein
MPRIPGEHFVPIVKAQVEAEIRSSTRLPFKLALALLFLLKRKPLALLLMALALSGCDSLALGYVNKLQHRVTIVEQGGPGRAHPIDLKPGEILTPGFGPRAESIDIIGPGGQILAHYRTRDIPRIAAGGRFEYVVIQPNGAVMELKDHLE